MIDCKLGLASKGGRAAVMKLLIRILSMFFNIKSKKRDKPTGYLQAVGHEHLFAVVGPTSDLPWMDPAIGAYPNRTPTAKRTVQRALRV